jgi:hypothetical protein
MHTRSRVLAGGSQHWLFSPNRALDSRHACPEDRSDAFRVTQISGPDLCADEIGKVPSDITLSTTVG